MRAISLDPDGIESLSAGLPDALRPRHAAARAVLSRAIVHIPDIRDDPDFRAPGRRAGRSLPERPGRADAARGRTDRGDLRRRRENPRPSRKADRLLQTFADQAVIAIENVRLFNETKEALEQQTATAEILRVIASSPTDFQPVFDIIAANALKLCDADVNAVTLYDGELLHLVALANVNPEGR